MIKVLPKIQLWGFCRDECMDVAWSRDRLLLIFKIKFTIDFCTSFEFNYQQQAWLFDSKLNEPLKKSYSIVRQTVAGEANLTLSSKDCVLIRKIIGKASSYLHNAWIIETNSWRQSGSDFSDPNPIHHTASKTD